MAHHLPCDNCDKVFGETDKWVTHKRWCKNKSCNLGLAMYRCYDCDKIFCNEGEVLRHEASKTHAKRVRMLKIEASPDFKSSWLHFFYSRHPYLLWGPDSLF